MLKLECTRDATEIEANFNSTQVMSVVAGAVEVAQHLVYTPNTSVSDERGRKSEDQPSALGGSGGGSGSDD